MQTNKPISVENFQEIGMELGGNVARKILYNFGIYGEIFGVLRIKN